MRRFSIASIALLLLPAGLLLTGCDSGTNNAPVVSNTAPPPPPPAPTAKTKLPGTATPSSTGEQLK